MLWIAPSEKDTDNAALEKRFLGVVLQQLSAPEGQTSFKSF